MSFLITLVLCAALRSYQIRINSWRIRSRCHGAKQIHTQARITKTDILNRLHKNTGKNDLHELVHSLRKLLCGTALPVKPPTPR